MYIVRSLNMTNWLCKNGFRIAKVKDSENNSRFKVFLFADTNELHDNMTKFHSEV